MAIRRRTLTDDEIQANKSLAKSARQLSHKFAKAGDTETSKQAAQMADRAEKRVRTGKTLRGWRG